jgi:hypothetical protein
MIFRILNFKEYSLDKQNKIMKIIYSKDQNNKLKILNNSKNLIIPNNTLIKLIHNSPPTSKKLKSQQ